MLLFALINNLEEINYGFRPTPGDGELEKDAYISHVTHSRNDMDKYLETIGLEWDDFKDDWNNSVEKMYTAPPVSSYEPQAISPS